MDDVTEKVARMYADYPYPSPSVGMDEQKLNELANLFKLLALETKLGFADKHILDAGTGTGHRLVAAAQGLPETRFTALDMVEASLDIARQVAAQAGLSNITFKRADIMEDAAGLGRFDVVLCMGVLHHLSDPLRGLRNLRAALTEDGFLLLYLYGLRGAQERMRRKAVISLLRGENGDDMETGIRLAKELEFDRFDYGWSQEVDEATKDSFIVDAFMNVNETLYEAESLHVLAAETGFHAYVTYGITTGTQGYLFDSRLETKRTLPSQMAPAKLLQGDLARSLYERLSLPERYRLLDLLYDPNGYTVIMATEGAREALSRSPRLSANFVEL